MFAKNYLASKFCFAVRCIILLHSHYICSARFRLVNIYNLTHNSDQYSRERRKSNICQILRVPQVLRPDPDLREAGRVRHSAAREEGFLRPRLQWGAGCPALGQRRTKVNVCNGCSMAITAPTSVCQILIKHGKFSKKLILFD